MDPVTALLIALWIAGRFTKNVYQDSVYKARGEDPPSYRREQERRRARIERLDRGPGPGRRFWRNAWDDACAEADERRARRFEKRQQRLRDRWATEDAIEEAEERAWEENRARDQANQDSERPRHADDAEPGSATGDDTTHEPTGQCEICGKSAERMAARTVTTRHAWPAGTSSRAVVMCPACAAEHDAAEAAPASRGEREPAQPEADDTVIDSLPETAPADATVIRPAAWNRPPSTISSTQEGDPMSAESHNLSAALAYMADMAEKCDAAVASVEQSIAGMTNGGVTGPAITEAIGAQEALARAAAQFRSAHAELTHHIAVKEAYLANEGAGEKAYVTSD